ncbi:hypothetical protein TanjilG_20749 [Lupinus angustifolius]|uniref:Transcription factor MYC/MYB N-terminal domain-containing protein n=1 Tax=Lupinus angustifolius TaxID=3871 RepID=A0A4P1QRQ7_LUPAN|nr:hypothetical protein TanjilG_20749 [Lupinus angustifolius]
MEEHLTPMAVTHLLQHTLRSLWEAQGAYDRSRGNRRNWILVWEDGFCNFAASAAAPEINTTGDCPTSSVYGNCDQFQPYQGLQPELFFKMSHEIYNYGEGLIGKVASDHSHKWIYKEPNDQEINFLSAWHNSADSHPRTWEAQFQSGIKTIALIAVREGVVQLGAVNKVIEDLSYVVLLRKKFSYIESIPGVLLPHPSSSAYPYKVQGYSVPEQWHFQGNLAAAPTELYSDHYNMQPLKITPSMSSLEALLSKLPSVVPPPQPPLTQPQSHVLVSSQRPLEFMGMQKVAKEELDAEVYRPELDMGESSISMPGYHHQHHFHQQHDQNVTSSSGANNGY